MKIKPDKNLFWFLKDNAELDLANPASLEMHVQQVISRGRMDDVKFLLAQVNSEQLKSVFLKIKGFLAWEVRKFWEDFIEDH